MRINEKRNRKIEVALLLIASAVPWLTILQYAPVYFESIMNRTPTYFMYSSPNNGLLAYSKDAAFILFGLCWPVAFLLSEGASYHRDFLRVSFFELIVIVFGLIGYQTATWQLASLVAGLRMMIWIHAGLGIFFFMRLAAPPIKLVFAWACIAAALTAATCGIVQLYLCPSQTIRYISLFGNSIVFGGCMAGGATMLCMKNELFPSGSGIVGSVFSCFLMSTLIGGAYASGSRSALISCLVVSTIMCMAIIRQKYRIKMSREASFLVLIAFSPVLATGALTMTQSLSNRGDVLEQNLGANGRSASIKRVTDAWLSDENRICFGGGIGWGTNTYVMLTGSREFIADNTIISSLLQFGMVGSVAILVVFFIWFPESLHVLYPKLVSDLSIPFVTIIFILTGNLFENQPLFFLLAAALGLNFSRLRIERKTTV